MPSQDPFSQVYDAVWKALQAHKPLMDLLRPGNRIRFDDTEPNDPEKENVREGDLPELMLSPAGIEGQPWATSSSSQLTQGLELQLTRTFGIRGDWGLVLEPLDGKRVTAGSNRFHFVGTLVF